MKRILQIIILIIYPISIISQANYSITINDNPSNGNLFFQLGGSPSKPILILDKNGNEIYSQDLGKKGWDFKVNKNNKLSFFDRLSKSWMIMDSIQNITDTIYCKNGYIADNHDFIALSNGNYVLFSYDEQPYAMDTVVTGGDPNATIVGLIMLPQS